MTSSRPGFAAAFAAAVLLLPAAAFAQGLFYDIGSGGQPTITGTMGGSVVFANPSTLSDLVVTIDLGEVSPVNPNATVRVVVPIAIRSNRNYQVTATIAASSFDANALAIQASDIGFGAQNIRMMVNGQACTTHRVLPPFDNDPALSVNRTARASYLSSLNSLAAGAVVLRGPKLSKGGQDVNRRIDNGYVFDAIFAIVPQFFLPGSASFTIRFAIAESTVRVGCN